MERCRALGRATGRDLRADLGHGGTEDPYFSEEILRETAEEIPDAALRLYDGAGYGIPKERKHRYEDDVLTFLDGRLEKGPRRSSGDALVEI